MRRVVLAMMLAAACGGTQIPQHNGYKADNTKPWKKAKAVKLDDKGEAKLDGSLNYAQYTRAKWYGLELPSNGNLAIKMDITPPGDATNDDFDLALEVLDPGNRVIAKSDLEEADAHELGKTKNLVELPPGKYLIHVYLQGRNDSAEFSLKIGFTATAAAERKSDFPAQVAFVPPLPQVSLNDEAPKDFRTKPAAVVTHVGHRPVPPPPKPVAVAALTARILQVNVVGGGTQLVIGRGTDTGANDKMHGIVNGTKISFTMSACSPRTCTAVVSATMDQIKASQGDVSLSN